MAGKEGGRKRKEAEGLSARDERAALALASGQTREEAAASAGMGVTTLYGRLRDPAFNALVTRLRSRLVSEAIGKLAKTAKPAAEKLAALLEDSDPKVALQAAKVIIAGIVRLGTYDALDVRIQELEATLRQRQVLLETKPRLAIPLSDDRSEGASA
jgi:hypothetical protein